MKTLWDETVIDANRFWTKMSLDETIWMKVSLVKPFLGESVVDEIVFCFG